MALRKQVEKDFAKILFVNENISQKQIALRLKVTEKTIGKWIKEGNWDSLKVSMLVTKDNQLTSLYKQLETLNNEILTRPIVYDIPTFLLRPIKLKDSNGDEYLEFPKISEKDYPIKIGNVATSKDADIISKITSSIKKLETETNIGETVEVAKQLIQFISSQDIDFAKHLTEYCDAFITAKMKK
jgi:transcriptional regulator with XRE-family HTH domain